MRDDITTLSLSRNTNPHHVNNVYINDEFNINKAKTLGSLMIQSSKLAKTCLSVKDSQEKLVLLIFTLICLLELKSLMRQPFLSFFPFLFLFFNAV